MTITATDNLAIALRYLEAIENGAEGGALAEFFAQDVVQEEFPNRLSPIGTHRDLKALLASARKGKQTIRAQKFDILNSIVDGDIVEIIDSLNAHFQAELMKNPRDPAVA